MKFGHSYVRWSTKDQGKGDSLRRQIADRDRVCLRRGITLVESYEDRGRSAHRGQHRVKGDMARLLKNVGQVIKPGEYLLVENIDRLPRENPRKAWNEFNALIDAGIIIITTYDDREFSSKTIDEQPYLMHELLGEMQRAHAESLRKSVLIAGAWESNRNRAAKGVKKITSVAPAWLEPIRDELGKVISFTPIEERKLVVGEIFDLAANGMGQWSIAKVLNERGVPPSSTPGRTHTINEKLKGPWRPAYIGKIIASPAVLGHYQPKKRVDGKWEPTDLIPGYFGEPIVDAVTYQQANAIRVSNDITSSSRQRRGKTHANLFNKRMFCDECGSPMFYKTYTGKRKDGTRRLARNYLHCEAAKVGHKCQNNRGYNYDYVQDTILRHIHLFPIEDLLSSYSPSDELQAIGIKTDNATARLAKLANDQAKAMEFMKAAESPDEAKVWREDLKAALAEIKTVEGNLAALMQKKAEVEFSLQNNAQVRDTIERLKERMNTVDSGERHAIRHKLSEMLKTFISQVRFNGQDSIMTVILHELGLVSYRFSTTKPGGAPKSNPMKLLRVKDLRPQIGDPAKGMIPREVFTSDGMEHRDRTGKVIVKIDADREASLNRMMEGGCTQPPP